MKIVLIGIPGAGKSTQGTMLSKQLKIPYLSTGHIFRAIAKEKTPNGRYIKETMNAGHNIPDDITIPIVEEYLSRPAYKKGYILDGFPRNLYQVKRFKNGVDKVIYIDLPDKEALWRIAFRSEDRDDQTINALQKRISLFHEVTKPVTEYYEKKGALAKVDGRGTIEEVNKSILKQLGKEKLKNSLRKWEQKQKIILAITGLPGSGKTEASDFFKEKGIPVIHFGNTINHLIEKKGLEHTEAVHNKVRMELRDAHGMAAIAVMNVERIQKALQKEPVIVIDGLYSFQEYEYLKNEFKKSKVVILSIWSDKHVRYKRIKGRNYRKGLSGEERDLNEIIKANKGPTIAFADYLIKNDATVEDFHRELENVYREIYFSLDE